MPGEEKVLSVRERRREGKPFTPGPSATEARRSSREQHTVIPFLVVGGAEEEAVFFFPIKTKVRDFLVVPEIVEGKGTLCVFIFSEKAPTQVINLEVSNEVLAMDGFEVEEKSRMYLRFDSEDEASSVSGLLSFKYKFR